MSKKNVQTAFVLFDGDQPAEEVLFIKRPDEVKITNKKQSDAFAKKKMIEQERIKDIRGNFVISKNEPLKGLEAAELTMSDRSYLMLLLQYAKFEGKPLTRDGEPLNAHTIATVWGVHFQVATRKLRHFIKLGILKAIANEEDKRVKNYLLNEEYFLMGKVNGEKYFVKLFLKKLTEVIENVKFMEEVESRKTGKPAKIVDVIGLLNAVMPYFHYQTYYLVNNPNDDILLEGESVNDAMERNNSALKHLTRAQIGRILGSKSDPRTIDKYMDYLQAAGAVMVTKNKNKRRYLIHPDLMFRQDGQGMDEYTRTIRNQFGQH